MRLSLPAFTSHRPVFASGNVRTNSASVDKLRQDVDAIARNGLFNLEHFNGEIAYRLDYDELEARDLGGKCGTYSPKLQEKLAEYGYKTQRSTSRHPIALLPDDRGSFHVYLITRMAGQEIIIDPTLGQFVKGHNRIFIGTRSELEALVMNPAIELVRPCPRLTRQEIFWSHWGSEAASLETHPVDFGN